MVEPRCSICDGTLATTTAPKGTSETSWCPQCGFLATISRSDPTGAETIFYPKKALAEEPEATDRTAEPGTETGAETGVAKLDPTGPAGTALIDTDRPAGESRPAETFLQAHLLPRGSMLSERLPLTGESTVVGRKLADIVIKDPTLSSSHFEIESREGRFYLRDLASSNGTHLNGHRIRSARLSAGDLIEAGQSRFVFGVLEVLRCEKPAAPGM